MRSYDPGYGNSYALVVAIDRYRHMPSLDTAIYGARTVADLLASRFGFRVHILTGNSISRPSVVLNALDELGRQAGPHDRVLIYYAGYGATLIRGGRERGFLTLPTSTPGRPRTALSIDNILKRIKAIPAKHVLLVADACLNGLELRAPDASACALDDAMSQRALQVIVAGYKGQELNERWGKTGLTVFTGLFVDKLSERAGAEDLLTANGLGLYLQLEVGRYTESRQVPYFGYVEDSERGDFVFRVAQPGVKLPEGLLQDLHSPQAGAREDAVEELAYLLRKGEEALAQWAREELTYLSQEDNSPSVQRAALKALEVACLPTPAKLPIAQFIASCTDAMERRHLSFESEIILIPAGPFLMGSSADNPLALDEEKPQHNINLPDYSIARTPVTNAQYANFVAVTGYPVPDHWESVDTLAEKLDHPVVWVSWYDALAYCAWLTETWQERGKIGTDKVVRLPTEAEWEKAARGEDGREYPWGNVFDPTRCNHEGSGIGDTTPVGKYSPRGDSPYSCADMAGNVWEWTSSLWGKGSHKPMFAYPYDLFDGREHLSADDSFRRIIRGGAYYYTADCVRCATRNLKFPYTKHSGGGFRIVVSKRGRC